MDTRWRGGEGDASGLELCSGVHGIRALYVLARSTEGEGERGGSGDSEGETEREHRRIQIEAAAPAEHVGHVLAWWGAQLGHGRHASKLSSTWRASAWAWWDMLWVRSVPN